MLSSKIIKKCLIPAAAVIAEAKLTSDNEKCVCRPSELPIYTPEPVKQTTIPSCNEQEELPGVIENAFKVTRQAITKYTNELQAYRRVGAEQLCKGKENVEWAINYLQEENNTTPKAGAIGIGALTGLIFGLRGGFFKKTLYSATGALGMGAVCYPKEAAEYSEIGLTESKKYLTIAYNFIYGVKKDDPPLELPSLPKLSISWSETWDSVKSTATSFVSDNKDDVKAVECKVGEENVKDPCKVGEVKDPLEVITESHDTAMSRSCHCPVGACLGHSDEGAPTSSPPMEANSSPPMEANFSPPMEATAD